MSRRPSAGSHRSKSSRRSRLAASGAAAASSSAAAAYHVRMEQRAKQARTNYSLGDDKTTWETEYSLIKPSRVVAAAAPVKVNRNASDSRDIFGDMPIDPAEHYKAEAARTFAEDTSVKAKGFERVKPLPGFDRKTANRTNYELGLPGTKVEYKTQNQLATMHPKEMKAGVNPQYKPRRDGEFDFDIITGRPRDPALTYAPSGLKKTTDIAVPNRTRHTTYDIISGRVKETVAPPPKRTSAAVTVKAPLGSLACLRPPTGQELL